MKNNLIEILKNILTEIIENILIEITDIICLYQSFLGMKTLPDNSCCFQSGLHNQK